MKCGKIFVNIIENLKIKVEQRIFWHDQFQELFVTIQLSYF